MTDTAWRWGRTLALSGGALLAVVVVAVVVAFLVLHRPRPVGTQSAAVRTYHDRMVTMLDRAAWERTGAVRFVFPGGHAHLWDRARGLSRVRWGDFEVLQRVDQRVGRAWESGKELRGEARTQAVAEAWEMFANDSFWLAAPFKAQDPGAGLSEVALDGSDGLLVVYTTGGVTPGDAYLWLLEESGRPRAWRMWVSVIPIGGLEVSWEGWKQLSTGAWVSTEHRLGPISIALEDVEGAASVEALEGIDPFTPLLH